VPEHAANAKRAMQTGMHTAVRLLRVLRDGKTSVVVQVLESNAVLKCEVTETSTQQLQQGQTVTIQPLNYDPPCLRVSIQHERHDETLNESTQQPRRKRMCFDDFLQ